MTIGSIPCAFDGGRGQGVRGAPLGALRLDCLDRVALGSFRQNAFGCDVLSEIAPYRIAQ